MKVVLGGARGSFPVSGSDKVRYGGDTFSLLVEDRDGGQILIDAGSGARNLKGRWRPGGTLFFTHTHLDHLLGLPMLEETWPSRMILPRGGLEGILSRVFAPPVWPVKLPAAASPEPAAPMAVGGLAIAWHPVAHPDGCHAYRVDEPATGARVVVATDVEWRKTPPAGREAFARFADAADLLVFDAHFRPDEYEAHEGWGHSTWADAAEAAHRCGAKKLWLMHHAPSRTDAQIDAMAAEAAAAHAGAVFPTVDAMTETLHE